MKNNKGQDRSYINKKFNVFYSNNKIKQKTSVVYIVVILSINVMYETFNI